MERKNSDLYSGSNGNALSCVVTTAYLVLPLSPWDIYIKHHGACDPGYSFYYTTATITTDVMIIKKGPCA